MSPPDATKPATDLVSGLRDNGQPGQLDHRDSATPESKQVVSLAARRAERLLDRLDLARDRLDRAVALIEHADELREQLGWGVLDLDDAVAGIDAFKRGIDAYRRNAS